MSDFLYDLRPHHGMCICFFQGKGYSSTFSSHMAEVIRQLQTNPPIRITDRADIICEKCPNNVRGVCITARKVAEYDRQVLLHCGLTVGTVLPFADFQAMVREKILSAGKREQICGNCQWSGICF